MRQPPRSPQDQAADFDDHVIHFPTRPPAGDVPTKSPALSADHLMVVPGTRVRTRAIREVVVLEVAGQLSEVVQELDLAIQMALAEGPRGVVCNLSSVIEGAEPGAVEVLATAGRHVRDWPGAPVAVACSDPQLRAALAADTLGAHLIVTDSMLPALSKVLETVSPRAERLSLAPHPTAPRASREFVTRTLEEWNLGSLVRAACFVVNELVTNATTTGDPETCTDIDLALAWNHRGLRLAVRDSGPLLPRQRSTRYGLVGRGQSAVSRLSRARGALPTRDGGKVVWAVLNAVSPTPATR